MFILQIENVLPLNQLLSFTLKKHLGGINQSLRLVKLTLFQNIYKTKGNAIPCKSFMWKKTVPKNNLTLKFYFINCFIQNFF